MQLGCLATSVSGEDTYDYAWVEWQLQQSYRGILKAKAGHWLPGQAWRWSRTCLPQASWPWALIQHVQHLKPAGLIAGLLVGTLNATWPPRSGRICCDLPEQPIGHAQHASVPATKANYTLSPSAERAWHWLATKTANLTIFKQQLKCWCQPIMLCSSLTSVYLRLEETMRGLEPLMKVLGTELYDLVTRREESNIYDTIKNMIVHKD